MVTLIFPCASKKQLIFQSSPTLVTSQFPKYEHCTSKQLAETQVVFISGFQHSRHIRSTEGLTWQAQPGTRYW